MNSNNPFLKSFDFNALKKSHGNGTSKTQTHRHRDYWTESAQWADSVKSPGLAPKVYIAEAYVNNRQSFSRFFSPSSSISLKEKKKFHDYQKKKYLRTYF